MSDHSPAKISTSALAKLLDIPSQQLFSRLKDHGWIRKLSQGWELTSKGEFDGGEYVHSKRYGRYIVWPTELAEHPLLLALENNRHLSASSLGKAVAVSAREINRLLAELGWIKHDFQGWQVTVAGEVHGGVQLENENSGTQYVVWPQAIAEQPLFVKQLEYAAQLYPRDGRNQPKDQQKTLRGVTPEEDLFSQSQSQSLISLDGHQHQHRGQLQICHWLYMAGLAHACQRQLPIAQPDGVPPLVADFYLPAHQLYIEYWHDEDAAHLSRRLQRQQWYEQLSIDVININAEDLTDVDELLSRQFRKLGIRVY